MGQSRHNPMSTQYKGADKPKAILGTDIRIVFEPNATMKAHLEEMKAAGIEGPVQFQDKDMDVVMYAMSTWGCPLQVVQEVQTSNLAFAELGRMPLTEFKRKHKTNFENSNMKTAADSIVLQEESALAT